MKSFLIPIHPERCMKIFNGDKTIEIRRTAPKDWADYLSGKTNIKPKPMTGYIYCPKSSREKLHKNKNGWFVNEMSTIFLDGVATEQEYNGKVVAKFTLREVEKVHYDAWGEQFYTEKNDFRTEVLSKSCLSYNELKEYYFKNEFKFRCYAWHISDLEIFDEPKELSEFNHICPNVMCDLCKYGDCSIDYCLPICTRKLIKSPQSWMYVEGKE